MARIENEPVAPIEAVDLTAAVDARAELPPEVLAQSLGEYLRGWWARVRNGDSGVLPVVIGIVGIAIAFQILNGRFLEPLNLVNLFSQSTIYMVLAMAEIFVLLLGEIDLSVGPGHGPGRGRRLRAGAAVRALQRRRRGDRQVPDQRPGLAVVGGDRRHAAHLCGHRRHPGEPGRPAAHAGPGRHPRRQPDPRRRDLHHPEQLGAGLDHRAAVLQRARHLRHLQWQVRPAGRVGRPGRGGGGGRRVALAARREPASQRPGGPPGGAHGGQDRPHRRRRAS